MNKVLFGIFLLVSNVLFAQISEPPRLTCVRNNGADIELFWDLPVTNCGGAFNSYDIYSAATFNGPYGLEQSIPAAGTTTAIVNNPGGFPRYFYIKTNRSCPPGTIVPTSDTLDNIKPQPSPRILSVSVTSGNDIEVKWTANPSKEVVGYLIYNDNNGFNIPDTVWGRTNTFFLDTDVDVVTKTNRYFIRTFEFCENDTGFLGSSLSDAGILEIHSSILLNYNAQDRCNRTALISWNKYENWGFQGGVQGYIVWMDSTGSGFIPVDTLSSTDSLYNVPNIFAGKTYQVKVSAQLPGNQLAYSNAVSFSAQTALLPQNFHIYNATPVADGTIEVSYHNEVPDAVASTQMQRSFDGVNFDNVNGREQTPPGAVIRIFKDGTANPGTRAAWYRFIIRDSCDVAYSSGTINTVFLTGEEQKDGGIDLQWNPFAVSDGAPDRYELVKYFNGVEISRTPLGTSTLVYSDPAPFRPEELDTVCYQIEVPFTVDLGSTTANNLTISNRICFTPTPKAYVPNAFKPEGIQPENRRIKPNLTYATGVGYLFQVFNRYGELMFTSIDPDLYWDGMYKDQPAPLDSYVYVVNFQGLDGVTHTKKGVIMLLR